MVARIADAAGPAVVRVGRHVALHPDHLQKKKKKRKEVE